MEEPNRFSRVLVTGANGFYAAAIMDDLVTRGVLVHGTVRTRRAAAELEEKYKDRIKIFLVPDICNKDAFIEAVHGVDAIFHVASPFTDDFTDAKKDFLDPAIQGALSALNAANTESKVKRLVLTSSCAAILDPLHPDGFHRPGYTYTEADWNPLTYEEACQRSDFDPVYTASKKLAEEAAWKFMRAGNRHFDLVTINPCHTWGRYSQPVDSPLRLNKTNAELAWLMDGHESELPVCHMPWACNITEVAMAHIKALYTPAANGRYIIANRPLDFQQVVDIMYQYFPDADWLENVPRGNPGTRQVAQCFTFDNSRSIHELGMVYGPIERAVIGFCEQYQKDRKRWLR